MVHGVQLGGALPGDGRHGGFCGLSVETALGGEVSFLVF